MGFLLKLFGFWTPNQRIVCSGNKTRRGVPPGCTISVQATEILVNLTVLHGGDVIVEEPV